MRKLFDSSSSLTVTSARNGTCNSKVNEMVIINAFVFLTHEDEKFTLGLANKSSGYDINTSLALLCLYLHCLLLAHATRCSDVYID